MPFDVEMPKSTRTASDIVRETIERDGVVRQGLARGLVNARALARSLQAGATAGVTFDAILSAIRRYPVRSIANRHQPVGKIILKLSMKNRVAVVSVRNRPELQRAIAQLAGEVNYARGETFRVVSAGDAVSVTLDARNAASLESKVARQDVLRKLEPLAELVIDMAPEADRTPGVLAAITTELAVSDVNIVQMTSVGVGRVLVLTADRDAIKAYRALESMSRA